LDDITDPLHRQTGNSKRQNTLTRITQKIPEYLTIDKADQKTNEDGYSTADVISLHIHFGNLCNMKCLMCNPGSSSLWYDYYTSLYNRDSYSVGNHNYKIYKDEHNRSRMDYVKWWETDIWWNRFSEVMPKLRQIYFTGGEPFLVPALEQCLDLLIDNNFAKDIILRFDTNLSVVNKKILDKLKKFKDISLCVSIDETEERYELIRLPGKFNTFVRNIETILSYDINITYISSCVGLASIYAIPRVYAFADKYNLNAEFRFLEGPKWLDIRYLPTSAKNEIIEKYTELSKTSNNKHWYKVTVDMLKKFSDEKHCQYVYIAQFVRNMDILDKNRNTNWRKTLPDVYDLLHRHCKDKIPNL
jgi:MoaA/NifB/PqqE/SkfB family radical SAM enzyme